MDQVHDLMDDVAEQQEVANEISEAISNPVGFGQDIDDVSSWHLQFGLSSPLQTVYFQLWRELLKKAQNAFSKIKK